jgi:hypothetical protein
VAIVIHNLLTAIVTLLQTELAQYLSRPPVVTIAITKLTDPTSPAIAIYPGQWEINHSSRDLTQREFQQEFWIEIYDQDFARLEQGSSLITGILIANHDTLLEQYNTPKKPKNKTQYQARQVSTIHTLSQFRLLEGIYLYPKTGVVLQLKLIATGQIQIENAIADGMIPIQKIAITGKAGEQIISSDIIAKP